MLKTVKERAFLRTALQSQRASNPQQASLRQCLGAIDVLLLGIGGTIGSGLFVVTGVAASQHAGPAVAVSYLLAACAALLAGLCYTQLVVEMPVAGGATVYVAHIFGELPSWIVASNLILEYSLSVAAVGRSASGYFATLLGLNSGFFIIPLGQLNFDPFSLALILLLSGLLAYGTEASNKFNIGVTSMNLVVILYVLCAGFPYGNIQNVEPFMPFGVRGVFTAASIVFFSFVGFDAAATAAEEVHRPERDLPVGIVGAILFSAVLYVLMSLCICLMRPSSQLDLEAPFAAAFTSLITPASSRLQAVFLATSARFVSFGALTGIITSLLVSILGQARIYVVLGRTGLLPAWLAHINPQRQNPVNATWLTGVSSGLLASLMDLDTLAELVSIGTLFVFFMVACTVLWQRYSRGWAQDKPLASLMACNTGLALGVSAAYTFEAPPAAVLGIALCWLASCFAFWLLDVAHRPKKFAVPLSPFLPLLAVLLTLHLIGSLGWKAYVRFGVWLLVSLLVYVFYGARNASMIDENVTCDREIEVLPLSSATKSSEELTPLSASNGRQEEDTQCLNESDFHTNENLDREGSKELGT